MHFRGEVDTLLQRYGIQHHRSSTYRPQTNGAIEAANKNIKRILRKMIETFQDWSKKLPFTLWAYRTSFRTSTRPATWPQHGRPQATIRPSTGPRHDRPGRSAHGLCAQAGSGCAHCTPDSVLTQCTVFNHCLDHCS